MIPHYWSGSQFMLNPYFHPLLIQNPAFLCPQMPPSSPPSVQPPPKHQNKIEKGEKIQIDQEDLEREVFNSSKKTWTQDQDFKLCHLIEKEGLSWNEVALKMEKRTYKMCYSRYRRIQQAAKDAWTSQEDQSISSLVTIYGKSWKKISSFLQKRTPKQIRERYINFIRPNISKEEWTIEEDLKLIELINKHGRKWKKIEEELEVRTQNQIKNRFFNRILKIWRKKAEDNHDTS